MTAARSRWQPRPPAGRAAVAGRGARGAAAGRTSGAARSPSRRAATEALGRPGGDRPARPHRRRHRRRRPRAHRGQASSTTESSLLDGRRSERDRQHVHDTEHSGGRRRRDQRLHAVGGRERRFPGQPDDLVLQERHGRDERLRRRASRAAVSRGTRAAATAASGRARGNGGTRTGSSAAAGSATWTGTATPSSPGRTRRRGADNHVDTFAVAKEPGRGNSASLFSWWNPYHQLIGKCRAQVSEEVCVDTIKQITGAEVAARARTTLSPNVLPSHEGRAARG